MNNAQIPGLCMDFQALQLGRFCPVTMKMNMFKNAQQQVRLFVLACSSETVPHNLILSRARGMWSKRGREREQVEKKMNTQTLARELFH